MSHPALEELRAAVRGTVLADVPMAGQTTLKVGGSADLVVLPADRADLLELLEFLRARAIPWLVVGNGSNLLVRDGGIRGAVINLGEGLSRYERLDEGPQLLVRAEAGAPLKRFVRWTADEGIGGFAELCGIPGTIGGALAMNAGAWGEDIGTRVVELEVLHPDGRPERLPAERLRFEYRKLHLPEGAVIVEALLRGEPWDPDELRRAVSVLLERRRARQPAGERTAGSVFKNPPDQSAGRMIEECGLKGVRVGDAEVSALHANFIMNTGMATASQIVALMNMIQERVFYRYKVRLEPEVQIVGEWEKSKLQIRE